ncbi:siderophore-interacting protein [Octadecabacter sp. CECT 8868]|uniref:siderophore-interacting protein n=1 Tax=Octadecabacter algicola TaxID=2909342 RepID=UPI001F422C04|nr:siderophore-interacting protein [Octadecabacter algicola]MCF2905402.1 siderophore-interacting protein [Octadecabacter algicola]
MATPPKRAPRIMHVSTKTWVTRNMIRVTCHADWIKTLDAGIEGAHFKLFIPKPDQTDAAFVTELENGPRPDVRTYTIRYIRPDLGEIDIDFVDHGDAGPASAWARRCVSGDLAGFAGPGPIKLKEFYADAYIVAADMSALPVAAATLEAMPRDAKGVAFLEITTPEDQQNVAAPKGVDVHWLIHSDPHQQVTQSVDLIAALPEFTGPVQTCIAGESSMIKALREEIINRRGVPKSDAYISGYWKIGLVEDEHQAAKRAEAV